MNSLSQEAINYAAYAVFNIMLAREVNNIVTEPYMVGEHGPATVTLTEHRDSRI